MKRPSLGLRDKNRRGGERGEDRDLTTLQKPEETRKRESPAERAGDGEMMNSNLDWGQEGQLQEKTFKKTNVTI